jgi:membrane protein implicated in regulation of membrane protease activity
LPSPDFVSFLFLASFIGGLLLAVRLMFFGAERHRLPRSDALPLRRSEPAIVAFLVTFGISGYLSVRHGGVTPITALAIATVFGIVFAAIVTRLAIAAERIQPEHDPDDPRFSLQGRVGLVTVAIPADGEGMIRYEDSGAFVTTRARGITNDAIAAGEEVCIERIEDGVAHVELWSLVEERL